MDVLRSSTNARIAADAITGKTVIRARETASSGWIMQNRSIGPKNHNAGSFRNWKGPALFDCGRYGTAPFSFLVYFPAVGS